MASATTAIHGMAPAPTPGEIARVWVLHLTALYIPGLTLAFLWTGPHRWYWAAFFMVPLAIAHHIDCSSRLEQRQPRESMPAWPFDGLVYLLAALQIWIVAETVLLFTVQGIFSVDMVMVFLVVGGSSGFSIITAHELIHRPGKADQLLGRLLLCTVLYEHFYTEHLRGHHVRVGTPADPATARFGESYEAFFRRTAPAQFRSAWQLEKRRLGDADMRLWDRRMLRNRILHGLAVEWGLVVAVFAAFGLAPTAAFLLQAYVAVRLLEAVNYFEHWGLLHAGRRVRLADSWDTHSAFTYYGLIGLSRHADHHAWPARPYQQLRVWDEAPILPYGYVGMVDLVIGKNAEFQRLATEELRRRRLGPFTAVDGESAGEALSSEDALAQLDSLHGETGSRQGRFSRSWSALPAWARRLLLFIGVIGTVSLGVQWETGASEMGMGARLLLNGWILAAVAAALFVRGRLEEKLGNESLTWLLGFGLLLALGLLTDAIAGPLPL
ncbi:MAG: fatty acid desaturase [Proteobacteria bacterium]|nr:fatty acid desaturase [Pseudomonadota bacterium]